MPPTPFLDMLPPELRLRIYDHLLVADRPLKGVVGRRGARYGLDTKILRINKQIHAEARHAFFSKNTFHMTSLAPLTDSDVEGSGDFEPPLQAKDLPLIRHLEIDPLYYPTTLKTEPGRAGWKPVCPPADRYITNLTHLLTFVKPTLLSLTFETDTRPYAGFSDDVFGALASDDEALDDTLDVRKILTAFHVIEGNARFRKAVADLDAVRCIPVRFHFPESDFAFNVEKAELCRRGLLFLASQTIFARSEIKIKAMLDGFSDDGLEDEDEDEDEEEETASISLAGRRESAGVVEAIK